MSAHGTGVLRAAKLEQAFKRALYVEHGYLLAPEVRAWLAEERSDTVLSVAASPSVGFRWRVDLFVLARTEGEALMMEEPWRLASEAVDRAWEDLWQGATSGYMVQA